MHRSQRRVHRLGLNHPRRRIGTFSALIAVLLVAGLTFALLRSVPAPRLVITVPAVETMRGPPLTLHPPPDVQEAVAIAGDGTIAAAGQQNPSPIASLTKMMSALVVLRDHPLASGSSGPDITVSRADVASYRLETIEDDSVVRVRVGEQLSELQALEGALVPSGDNIIQLLATWDARSTAAFVAKMNALAQRLGMDHTYYAGPSGVNPATVSTASDQLRLAEVAMANPVFASIVAMPQVSLPVAGVEYNVDADLGFEGIDGIKTGWTPQSGGCFVFAAGDVLHGEKVSILGAIVGEEGATPIPTALATAKRLVRSTEKAVHLFYLPRRSSVAFTSAPYASSVRVITTSPISFVDWAGAKIRLGVHTTGSPGEWRTGPRVGTLIVLLGHTQGKAALTITALVHGPSVSWRLSHP